MRYCVDAHALGRHLTGNEAYVRNLLDGFKTLKENSEFLAYISVPGAEKLVPNCFETRTISDNPFIRLGFDLSRKLRRDRADLVHVQFTAPLACPVPVVVSVHDVSFLEKPEFFTHARRLQLQYTVKNTVRKAARVLTLSEFSRRSIARAYGMDPSKITVVPAGVSSSFRPLHRQQAKAFVEGRFKVPGPFILCVGDLQPRKNQIGLIHAFEELLCAHPDLPHQLMLVGKETWFAPHVHQAAKKSLVKDRIHFTNYVNEKELLQLYNACEIFVFPSFYEGFGLPILEAMACGRAVACSNSSAMPEVADSAGLLFNPESTGEMVRAMRDLLLNPELRQRMERLGQQNASQFSWARTAQMTLEVYHEVAGESRMRMRKATAVQS